MDIPNLSPWNFTIAAPGALRERSDQPAPALSMIAPKVKHTNFPTATVFIARKHTAAPATRQEALPPLSTACARQMRSV